MSDDLKSKPINGGMGAMNPNDAIEAYGDPSKVEIPKTESDSEKKAKYSWLGPLDGLAATIDTEISNKIDGIKQTAENIGDRASEIAGNPEEGEDSGEEANEMTPEEAQAAEEARLEALKKQYIVNAAIIECEHSPDKSYLIIPTSHGEFIQKKAQLNVADCKPNTNIVSFKVCQSTENPAVREAAKKVLEKAQDRSKGFFDRVMDLFSKPKEIKVDEIDDELVSQCAAECKCWFDGDATWIDGEETVLVDGKPALLGRCTAMCGYGGQIKFYTSGQEE